MFFVAVEIRQNTQATISASSVALTSQSLEFFALGIDSQVLAPALHKQEIGAALTPFEEHQIRRLQYFNFRLFENAYLQYHRGLYDESEWNRYRRIISHLLSDNYLAAQMWEDTESHWTVEFEKEVNSIRSAN